MSPPHPDGGAGGSSLRSAPLRRARRLQRRAERERSGLFLLEGPQAVGEALTRPDRLVELFVSARSAQRRADLVTVAAAAGVRVHVVDEVTVAALSETRTPQGVVGVARTVTVPLSEALAGTPRLVAVMAAARDPGNAGTLLRSADAAGADAVVLTEGSVDVHNGKCVRASAGSVFHLPVAAGAPLPGALAALRAAGLRVLAADGSAAMDLDEAEDLGLLADPVAWLFGNEAWGLPAAALDAVDHRVRVAIHPRAESLNLAAAAAVCLFATARAQRAAGA